MPTSTIRLFDINDVEIVAGKLIIAGYRVEMNIVAKPNLADRYEIIIEEIKKE